MRRRQQLSARALTFKLAAALEQYEADVRALVDNWLDRDLYRRLEEELKQLRIYCASLPRLSVSWMDVLVSRARLMQALVRRGVQVPGPTREARLLGEHLAAVEGLRRRCLRMMGAQSVVLT